MPCRSGILPISCVSSKACWKKDWFRWTVVTVKKAISRLRLMKPDSAGKPPALNPLLPRGQKISPRVLLMLYPHMLQRQKFHWHKQQHLKHHRLTLFIRHRVAARPHRFLATGSPVKIFISFAVDAIFPEILLMSMLDCLSSASRKDARHSIPGTTPFINTSCGNGNLVAAI